MEKSFIIERYSKEKEREWDNFIANTGINGTFLQSRRFLNYHPKDRFVDASYMIYNSKKKLIAVCPACEKIEMDRRILFSHGGSTYGGVIVSKDVYKACKLIDMLKALEQMWIQDGFESVILKQTPDLFSIHHMDLLQYALYYCGFQEAKELNLYVDLEKCPEDILSIFSQGKRTNVHNCQKEGLFIKSLSIYEEIKQFHALLSITLKKYDRTPVHTVDELYEFQNERLKDKCEIFGIYNQEGHMISGSMMFYFNQIHVAHTQYLCANPEYNKLSPMTFAYYSMIVEMKKRGYQKVSWGIATEDMGRYLNEGLVTSKECFGSEHSINSIWIKEIAVRE